MTEPATPTTKGPPYNPRRSFKNYLIDSRLQLRYAGILVLVTALISAALFAFLLRTSRAVVREAKTAADQSKVALVEGQRALGESLKVSEFVKMSFTNNPYYKDHPEVLKKAVDASKKQEDGIKAQQAALEQQKAAVAPQLAAVVQQQNTMLWSIIGSLVVLVILIALLGIFFTHKVAGPIYKMRGLLRQVGEGKLAFSAHLRKGDELQEFFGEFASMAESLREREQKELAELERAIELAKKAGVDDAALASVTSVRDEMKRSLEA